MKPVDVNDGSTSPTLLSKVTGSENHPGWVRFWGTYDPRVRRWCRGYGLREEAIDEICARVWCELAVRMRTFEYDPSGSFRGWLRQICEWRVLNYLHEQRAHAHFSLDDPDGMPVADRGKIAGAHRDTDDAEEPTDPAVRLLLDAGAEIQAEVRARVKPHNWEAFWLVAVYQWGVEQTAQTLGMKKAAVYAAVKRVRVLLRDEGRRVSEEWAKGA